VAVTFRTVNEIRRVLAEQVTATPGQSLRESLVILGDEVDPTPVADRRFSVIVGAQTNTRHVRDRGDGSGYMRLLEQLTVRISFEIRPNQTGDQLLDYDEALYVAGLVRNKLMQRDGSWQYGLSIEFTGAPQRRQIANGKFLLIDLAFEVTHLEALT
jgi:hypothetical protein